MTFFWLICVELPFFESFTLSPETIGKSNIWGIYFSDLGGPCGSNVFETFWKSKWDLTQLCG